MILTIRKRIRLVVAFLLFVFLQTFSTEVYALTSGPAQEEYASFEPIGTTDMVNLYTGDFTYNIPLLSVPGPNGGYPINLAYHSGVGMNQEASWVGLGWNVNVGAINRNLRGLPDDFNGDKVTHEQHVRKNWSVGLNLFQENTEIFGFPAGSSDATVQVYYNNYKGLGYRVKYNTSATAGAVTLGLALSYDPHEGIGVGASLSVTPIQSSFVNVSLGVSGQFNSRQGLQNIGLNGSVASGYNTAQKLSLPFIGDIEIKGNRKFSTGSGGVTFNMNHGVPAVTMPTQNTLFTTDVKLGFGNEAIPGLGLFRSSFPLNWSGFYSESKVRGDGISENAAYGYLHMDENATRGDLTDFSPAYISYNRKLPHISPSNVTNDIFSVTGQGMSGVFKGYRSYLGVYTPKKTVSTTEQYRASLDVGTAAGSYNTLSCGFSYQIGLGGFPSKIGTGESSTGSWSDGNNLVTNLNFKNPNSSARVQFERTFFKDIGDRPAIIGTDSRYDAWNKDEAVRIDISKKTGGGVEMSSFGNGVSTSSPNFSNETARTSRSRVIQSLTKEQSLAYGMSKNYKYYDIQDNLVSKYAGHQEEDHLSEISILEPDGMRYIYALPAYNLEQEDAAFSVEKQTANLSLPTPFVVTPADKYDKAFGDWSKKPEFLDKKNIPAYAHSWMLTSVVSADYVDLTGDGLSADDLGYWVDFKYQKTTGDYIWRSPYENSLYMPGTSRNYDDRGSYSKGKKELFYLKEIRTKTHVALFDTEDREDAIAASEDYNGGKPSSITAADKMQLLRKIRLYTIEEYKKFEANANYTPEPLKNTHFEYMHDNTANESKELCKGVPNHTNLNNKDNKERGKLTLHKVWFTYQKSNRGRISPYVFHYEGNNPDYSLKNNDCWGNYQDNGLANYPYQEFPYTDQSSNYDVPWQLTKIDMPTGSSLNIEYEQDDYAYVEDKKAMQMFDISFTGKGGDFATDLQNGNTSTRGQSGTPYTSSLKNSDHQNDGTTLDPDFEYRMYFKLKNPIPLYGSGTSSNYYQGYDPNTDVDTWLAKWLKKNYIGNNTELYFKAAVSLLNDNPARNKETVDFVGGYAELRTSVPKDHYGVYQSPNSTEYDYGYITVKPAHIKAFGEANDVIHPIRDAAFQHLKFNRSELVFGGTSASGVVSLFSAVPDLLTTLMGYKYAFKIQNWSSKIFLDGFSQMRLQVPDGEKRGGGSRVKKITINDNWSSMTKDSGGNSDYKDAEYGQIYDYTIEEEGKLISSGVAYEPFAGKEQNPMVTPARYKHSNIFQNPNNFFLENPVMMSHYPGASIGYRKVRVRSITTEDIDNKRSTAPLTEYEFFTPKDFPIEFKKTGIKKIGPNYKVIPIPGIYTEFRRYEGASQGYSLIFNDMAGKLKSVQQKTLPNSDEGYEGTVISKQEYEYFTDSEGKLDNSVDVFTENGVYEKARLGVEVDVQVEMSENKEHSNNFALDLNLISGIITIPTFGPVCLPMPIPASGGISKTSSSLKTAVVQKFISKKGILKSTTITTQNSTIKTENLVFDPMTSKPLLTRTSNEFEDAIYAYSQKAYWEYEGMAAAFKNVGTSIKGPIPLSTNSTHLDKYHINVGEFPFIEGDEVYVKGDDGSGAIVGLKGIVYTLSKINTNEGYIGLAKTIDGSPIDLAELDEITIIRSGRRNLLEVPVGGLAAMDVNYAPNTNLGDVNTLILDENSGILSASAVKYRDYWPSSKNCATLDVCNTEYCIPTISGVHPNNLANEMDVTGNVVLQLDNQTLSSDDIEIVGSCTDATEVPHTLCTNSTIPAQNLIVKVNGTVVTANPAGTCSHNGTDGYIDLPCQPEQKVSYVNGTGDYQHQITIDDGVNVTTATTAQIDAIPSSGNCTWSRIEFILDGRVTPQLDEGPIGDMIDFWDSPIGNQVGSTSGIDYSRYAYKMSINWPNRGKSVLGLGWHDHYQLSGVTTMPYGGAFTGHIRGLTANVVDPQMATTLGTIGGGPLIDWKIDRKLNFPFSDATPELYYYTQSTGNLLNTGGLQFKLSRVYDNQDIWGWTIQQTTTYNAYLAGSETFEAIRIRNLTVGQTYTIQYLRDDGSVVQSVTGVAQGTPTQATQIRVNIPANQTSTIEVLEQGNPNPIHTESVQAGSPPSTAIRINVPMMGIGTHQLDVFHNGNLVESTTHVCDANNVVEEIPLCDNSGNIGTLNNEALYGFYTNGTKGSWRAWTSYTYVTDRDYTKANLRDKGVFTQFTPFSWTGANGKEWQMAGLATKYDPHGYELESVNAIGNYSAALYSYNDNLPVAVVQNARYNEILFDGFENYPLDCNNHWTGGDVGQIMTSPIYTKSFSHTGQHSYKVNANTNEVFPEILLGDVNEVICAEKLEALDPVLYSKDDILDFLQKGIETPSMKIPKIMRTTTTALNNDYVTSLPKACDCLGKFAPQSGKKYTFSAWVKKQVSVYDMVTYNNVFLTVRFRNSVGAQVGSETDIAPNGSMIEKWQRMSGDIVIPTGATTMEIVLKNIANSSDVYLDDLRVHPFEANIATHVYDKVTLRNTATLDDNNYATFYIYDERGQLEKTKKETTEGIKTINEGRQHIRGPLNQ